MSCGVPRQRTFASIALTRNRASSETFRTTLHISGCTQMDMAYFLDEMKSKVSSAMQGADQKALGSQAYKDVLKQIIVGAFA